MACQGQIYACFWVYFGGLPLVITGATQQGETNHAQTVHASQDVIGLTLLGNSKIVVKSPLTTLKIP